MLDLLSGVLDARLMVVAHIAWVLLVVDLWLFVEEILVLSSLGHHLVVLDLSFDPRLDIGKLSGKCAWKLVLPTISIGMSGLSLVLRDDMLPHISHAVLRHLISLPVLILNFPPLLLPRSSGLRVEALCVLSTTEPLSVVGDL